MPGGELYLTGDQHLTRITAHTRADPLDVIESPELIRNVRPDELSTSTSLG